MSRRYAEVLLAPLAVAMLLAGCGSAPSKDEVVPAQVVDGATAAPVDPPEAIAAFERAMQHMNNGDAAGAEREFSDLSQKYPTYSGPLINLAILQVKSGRTQEAEASLKEALVRNPASAPAHNQLGILYRKLGRFKEASESYERAVQGDPTYALAHLNLGVLSDLYLGDPQRALQSFERYLQLEGKPQPQVQGWVKELRSRLGQQVPAAAESKSEGSHDAETGA